MNPTGNSQVRFYAEVIAPAGYYGNLGILKMPSS
jgi:hypothetical protein